MLQSVIKACVALGGITFAGWVLMVSTSPDKEEMMKRLPPELVTDEKLREVNEQNERIFASLKRTMESNEPIWKMKNIDNPYVKK